MCNLCATSVQRQYNPSASPANAVQPIEICQTTRVTSHERPGRQWGAPGRTLNGCGLHFGGPTRPCIPNKEKMGNSSHVIKCNDVIYWIYPLCSKGAARGVLKHAIRHSVLSLFLFFISYFCFINFFLFFCLYVCPKSIQYFGDRYFVAMTSHYDCDSHFVGPNLQEM